MQTNINKWPNILLSFGCKIIQLLPTANCMNYSLKMKTIFCFVADRVEKHKNEMETFEKRAVFLFINLIAKNKSMHSTLVLKLQ